MKGVVLAILVWLSSIAIANATTYFLSPSGSDSNACSSGSPCFTISHVDTLTHAGDTVVLNNGTYSYATQTINSSGTSGNPITYQAATPCTGVPFGSPSCSVIVQTSSGCQPGIQIYGGYVTFFGFQISNTGTCASYTAANVAVRAWPGYGAYKTSTPDSPLTVDPSGAGTNFTFNTMYIDQTNQTTRSLGLKTDQDHTLIENSIVYVSIESSSNTGTVFAGNLCFDSGSPGGPTGAEECLNSKSGARDTLYHDNVILIESGNTGIMTGGGSSGYWFDSGAVFTAGSGSSGSTLIIQGTGTKSTAIGSTGLTSTINLVNGMVVIDLNNINSLTNGSGCTGGGDQTCITSVSCGGGTCTVGLSAPITGAGVNNGDLILAMQQNEGSNTPSIGTHIECWYCYAWNNIQVNVHGGASFGAPISFRGCYDCGIFNNIAVGWVPMDDVFGSEIGFPPLPNSVNPQLANNIFWLGASLCSGCTEQTNNFGYSTSPLNTNNDFYNFGSSQLVPSQVNSITSNPNFVSPSLTWTPSSGFSGWALQSGSPAIAAGKNLGGSNAPPTFGGGTVNVTVDHAGNTRPSTGAWDMGIFGGSSGGGGVTDSLLVNGASSATITSGGSASLTWSSTGATSCSGMGFSTGGATSNSSGVSVSPTSTTTYTLTCTNGTSSPTSSVIVTVANGHLWYVDNSVATSGAGTSWAAAWKDFTNIVWGGSGVLPGDTIYISGGTTSQTYTDQINPTAGGSAGNPITITAGVDTGHNGQVIIDVAGVAGVFNVKFICGTCNDFILQNLTLQNPGDAAVLVNSTTADTTIVQNLTIHTGPGPTNGTAWGIRVQGNAGAVKLLNNTIDTPATTTSAASTGAISLQANTALVTISGNQLLENNASNGQGGGGAGNDCITAYRTGNMTINGNFCSHVNGGANNLGFNIVDMVSGANALISNNVIYMPVGDAIANNFSTETGFTGTMSYYNNTVYGNGASYLMTITAAGATLNNNIFYQSGTGFGVYETVAITSDYNLIYAPAGVVGVISGVNKTWATWQAAGFDAHGVNANPLFTTIANAAGGFALQITSPALNVGTTLSQVPTDYLGTTRPQGTAYDLGAFERIVTSGGSVSNSILLLGLGH